MGSPVVGLLLAAGFSRRFGAHKLMQSLRDSGEWVAVQACRNLLASVDRVVAVVKAGDGELQRALQEAGAETIVCEQAERGMGASIAAGVAFAPQATGWLIAPADMPWIDPATTRSIASAIEAGAAIAAPVFAGKRGHPVGFSSSWRESLLGLSGDFGARELLRGDTGQLQMIACRDAGILLDIDTPEDLRRHLAAKSFSPTRIRF